MPTSSKIADPQQVAGWNRLTIGPYKLFLHPQTSIHQIDDAEGRHIIALGDIFVAHDNLLLEDALLEIGRGRREMLDNLAGRFAIFVFDGKSARVMHDAIGSQSVFYSLAPVVSVSSHASLLAASLDRPASRTWMQFMRTDEWKAKRTRFLPGDASLYDGVFHLIPNNELEMADGLTHRYWPTSAVQPSSFDELRTLWHEYFSNYANYLRGRYRPLIGLTGGLDSRTVIATLNSLGVSSDYVTWEPMAAEEASRIPAMVEHLGGMHTWIRRDAPQRSAKFESIRDAARMSTGLTRGRPLLPAQMSEFVHPRSLFVKGLGGEILRGPANSRRKSWLPEGAEDMGFALYSGSVSRGGRSEYSVRSREAISGFLDRANYDDIPFGYDTGDLLYWEQRMGTWTSVQHAELSVVINSHAAINSRKLYLSAWGMPDEERFSDSLLHRIMASYDFDLSRM